jgi:hypothetical protein
MARYVNHPQLFGKMLMYATEYQDGLWAKKEKYRAHNAYVSFKKQVPQGNDYSFRIHNKKIFGVKFVWVRVVRFSIKTFTTETLAKGLFILRKDK